ncbi:flagellar basal body protein [Jannaschia sp. LMIT008]|uniref:flagellar basal body protein n=1 Tax=Jannaschia maritima TaxID=3032585 RepID=UPI002810FA02|nr:flagellar basal body protein [Jannaschia sp. LMIT008]
MQMPAILSLAADAARHAADRQAVTARNIVNADTPGFRPFDLTPFDPGLDVDASFAQRRTRPGHLGDGPARPWREVTQEGPLDPNGNGVDLETEILRGTDAQRAHNRAITVYRASMDLLRASLGRG